MQSFVIPAATPGLPSTVSRKRQMAEALFANSQEAEAIRSPWQGVSKLAQALMSGLIANKADADEASGRKGANDALAKALMNGEGVSPSQSDPSGDLVAAMNDPWQSSQGQQMLMQQWQQQNTPYKPDWQTIQSNGDVYRYDQNNPNAKPELFFDGPDEVAKPTDDMREYEFARSQGFEGTFQDYQLAMRRASATSVNVGGGSDKQIFDETKARADAARAASTGMNALNEAQKALPGAITGAGADARLALQKVGALLGVNDTSQIVDTETFRAAIAPQVAAMLKATVGTTQISNADREFAERAAGGSISLDGQSIGRLINIMRAANSETIRGFNRDLESVYPEGQGFDRERALFRVPNVPKTYAAPIGPMEQQGLQLPGDERSSATPSIPAAAVSELMADPSPQAMQEFDAVFGAGAAQRALQGQ